MKFGKIKTIIENNLSTSVKDKKIFKENIKNFKKHILSDKNLSKLYVLYGDLSKPRGMTESAANEYLNEGIEWAKKLIKKSKIPAILNDNDLTNNYESIDKLVYESTKSIDENVSVKKVILETLTRPAIDRSNGINLPISSMVKVANTKLNEYINTMNESTRKEILDILKEDRNKLNEDFKLLKEDTKNKLSALLVLEKNQEVKDKLDKAIAKVNTDNFDILNYYELKNLNKSLNE